MYSALPSLQVSGKNSAGEEQSLTFFVKIAHTQRSNTTYNPLLTFNFSTEITKKEEESAKTVASKFLEILNTESSYNQLNTAIDTNYDGSRDWTASYIGNVTGSSDDDTTLLEELFEGTLSLDLNGATVDVTCIIKRENIDNNATTGNSYTVGGTAYNGCEMTLYLTTANFNNLSYNDYPNVYAMVFTRVSEDSLWEQIGEKMYEGTAQVVGYVGGTTTGSFDTGTWTSSKEYHGISSGAKISELIQEAVS